MNASDFICFIDRCFIFARPRALAQLACALTVALLAGCNNVPARDSIDAKPPTGLPLPSTVKTVEKKATPVVPPPSESEAGMPIYPGAKTYVDDAGAPVPTQSGGMVMLETPDGIDKVVDFYKSKLTLADASGTHAAEPSERKEDGKRNVTLAGHDAQGNIQMALIHEGNGKTIIELMRTQAKALPAGVSGHTAPDNILSGSLPSADASGKTPAPSGTSVSPAASGTSGASGNGKMP